MKTICMSSFHRLSQSCGMSSELNMRTLWIVTSSFLRYIITGSCNISVCVHLVRNCHQLLCTLCWTCWFPEAVTFCLLPVIALYFSQPRTFCYSMLQTTAHVAFCCKMRVRLMKIFVKIKKFGFNKSTSRARGLKIDRNIK